MSEFIKKLEPQELEKIQKVVEEAEKRKSEQKEFIGSLSSKMSQGDRSGIATVQSYSSSEPSK